MNFSSYKVVLTGATGGIGGAVATALDQAGCQLLLTGRNAVKLQQVEASLTGNGHLSLVADLTRRPDLEALTETATRFHANVLINCMGVNQLALLDGVSDADVSHLITSNLTVPIKVCRALLTHLKGMPKATIVNVGSTLGSIGFAGSTLYCASKFGLRGFTESLRRELADTNIKVIYFAPRATDTDLNSDATCLMNLELGNSVDSPSSVANLLVDALAADKSANRFVGWPERFFVIVNSLVPKVVDKSLARQLATIKRYCEVETSV